MYINSIHSPEKPYIIKSVPSSNIDKIKRIYFLELKVDVVLSVYIHALCFVEHSVGFFFHKKRKEAPSTLISGGQHQSAGVIQLKVNKDGDIHGRHQGSSAGWGVNKRKWKPGYEDPYNMKLELTFIKHPIKPRRS